MLTVLESAKKIGVSRRYLSRLCETNRIAGAVQDAKGRKTWRIPCETVEKLAKIRRLIQNWKMEISA